MCVWANAFKIGCLLIKWLKIRHLSITFFLTIDYRSNGVFSVLKEKNDLSFPFSSITFSVSLVGRSISDCSLKKVIRTANWTHLERDPNTFIITYFLYRENEVEAEMRSRCLHRPYCPLVCSLHVPVWFPCEIYLFRFPVESSTCSQHSGMPNKNTHAWFV
jgi:hypothetical protein